MIGVAMIVGFSFQGTELIGIAAGESKDPGKIFQRQFAKCSGVFCCSISSLF